MTDKRTKLLEDSRGAWRAARAHALTEALDLVAPKGWQPPSSSDLTSNFGFALLNHTALRCLESAKRRDAVGIRQALTLLEEPHPGRPSRACSVVDGQEVEWRTYSTFDSPVGVLTPGRTGARPDDDPLLADAATWLKLGDHADYVGSTLGVAVVLSRVGQADTTRSYSLQGLPATAYCELASDSLRVAEVLLHESAHCWFNEQLLANQRTLEETPRWFSPWKDCQRPAFGILHGALAFSGMCLLFAAALESDRSSSFQRLYCQYRCRTEGLRLQAVEASAAEAARQLGRSALREHVEGELARAIAATRRYCVQ